MLVHTRDPSTPMHPHHTNSTALQYTGMAPPSIVPQGSGARTLEHPTASTPVSTRKRPRWPSPYRTNSAPQRQERVVRPHLHARAWHDPAVRPLAVQRAAQRGPHRVAQHHRAQRPLQRPVGGRLELVRAAHGVAQQGVEHVDAANHRRGLGSVGGAHVLEGGERGGERGEEGRWR